jgi:hypothetical protein
MYRGAKLNQPFVQLIAELMSTFLSDNLRTKNVDL